MTKFKNFIFQNLIAIFFISILLFLIYFFYSPKNYFMLELNNNKFENIDRYFLLNFDVSPSCFLDQFLIDEKKKVFSLFDKSKIINNKLIFNDSQLYEKISNIKYKKNKIHELYNNVNFYSRYKKYLNNIVFLKKLKRFTYVEQATTIHRSLKKYQIFYYTNELRRLNLKIEKFIKLNQNSLLFRDNVKTIILDKEFNNKHIPFKIEYIYHKIVHRECFNLNPSLIKSQNYNIKYYIFVFFSIFLIVLLAIKSLSMFLKKRIKTNGK